MTVSFLGTSIAEWLGMKTNTEPPAQSTWSEDELNALARGLGCSEHTFSQDGETFTYFLGTMRKHHPLDASGSRAVFAFGSAQVALGHYPYGAERLIREMAPDLLSS